MDAACSTHAAMSFVLLLLDSPFRGTSGCVWGDAGRPGEERCEGADAGEKGAGGERTVDEVMLGRHPTRGSAAAAMIDIRCGRRRRRRRSDLDKKGGVARVIERRSPCANAAPCRKVDLCPHGTSPLTPVRSSCNPLPRRRRSRSVAPLAELSPLCPVGRAGSAADLRSLPLPGDPL